jgi:hypothetical protein
MGTGGFHLPSRGRRAVLIYGAALFVFSAALMFEIVCLVRMSLETELFSAFAAVKGRAAECRPYRHIIPGAVGTAFYFLGRHGGFYTDASFPVS